LISAAEALDTAAETAHRRQRDRRDGERHQHLN
jgi:hypothetical protein